MLFATLKATPPGPISSQLLLCRGLGVAGLEYLSLNVELHAVIFRLGVLNPSDNSAVNGFCVVLG